MSNPASDEQLAALSSRLSSYPQSTTCEPGASPDMKRYLYAQQQLAAQGKARMRTWPKNSSTCCSHLQLTSHGLHTTTVLTSRSRAHAPAKQSYNPTDPSAHSSHPPHLQLTNTCAWQVSTPPGSGGAAHDADTAEVPDQAAYLEWAGAQRRALRGSPPLCHFYFSLWCVRNPRLL